MKQTFLFLFVISLFASQIVFASNASQVSALGLNDVVHADDDGKGDKKPEGGAEEEPDCE